MDLKYKSLMSNYKVTTTEPPKPEIEFIMPAAELEEFRRYLNQALTNLVQTRPDDPKTYLALALCQSIGLNASGADEFPELQKFLSSPLNSPQLLNPKSEAYPDGVQVKRRNSVVGESITEEELLQTPPVFEKSPELLQTLKDILKTNVLFSHIDDVSLTTIVQALESFHVMPGEAVVKQNDEGNSCFFVQSGKLECFVNERGLVGHYGPGDSFGEASIMYGNLRGATIQAVFESQLWKIDRIAYKKIVIKALQPSKNDFLIFLQNVKIFQKLDEEKVNEISKHSQKLTYNKGSHLQISGNDKYFYLIEKGIVIGEKEGVVLQEVKQYDWFGGREIFGLDPIISEIRAFEEVVVYRIPEQILDTLLAEISLDLFRASEIRSF